jgi:phosphoribosyl 1,2-cyclic phosphate phosphodiesterase
MRFSTCLVRRKGPDMTTNVKHNLQITILGCGSSGGVPRVGGDWGACDPLEPKNNRLRSSILVEYWQGEGGDMPPEDKRTVVLIDTSPDLRSQLLAANTQHIDAVFYTHGHGDQTHGIDDLRAIAYRQGARIKTYMGSVTQNDISQRFKYCFVRPEGLAHSPILDLQKFINDSDDISINGPGGKLPISVFEVGHGNVSAFGFIFCDKTAYTPDVHTISENSLEQLSDLDTWIIDALRYHSHPTHAHMDKCLHWGAHTRTKKMIFTNLHIDMDYQTVKSELIGPHEPAYDGMVIRI